MPSKCWMVLLGALLFQTPVMSSAATGWEQFGGPHRDQKVEGSGLFASAEIELEVVWSRPLGSGYSGFSVTDGRAVTLFSNGTSDLLVALDAASGDELWRYEIAPTYRGHSGSDDGPLGSPTLHGGLIYAVGRGGQLLAVELGNGELRWALDLERDFRSPPPTYGYSTSPFVHDGVLIVQTGGPGGHSITGLDPARGTILWSAGDDSVDHQSPLPAVIAGERQILAVGRHDMVGLRPATGEVLWTRRHRADPEVWAQPVLAGESGLFMSYFTGDGVFYRISGERGTAVLEEAWRTDLLKGSYVVPIYHGGYLYGFRGNLLFCVDPATGKEVWASREPGNGGTILVDGHLVTLAPRGQLVIGGVSQEGYEEKARVAALARGSLTPPSLAEGRLYVRNLSEAACIRIGGRSSPGARGS